MLMLEPRLLASATKLEQDFLYVGVIAHFKNLMKIDLIMGGGCALCVLMGLFIDIHEPVGKQGWIRSCVVSG